MTDEQTQMALQRVIDAIVERCQGWPVPEIRVALTEALIEIGHPPQSRHWIDAVAVEAADGHPYIVGTTTAHFDHSGQTTGPRAEDRPTDHHRAG